MGNSTSYEQSMLDEANRPWYEPCMIKAAYYFSSYMFILALGGLSHQESSKRGNYYGILGMVMAITLTCFNSDFYGWDFLKFFLGFALGGLVGIILAMKVSMISMPQMVALLHTFVGLAATIVAWGNYGKEFTFTGKDDKETGLNPDGSVWTNHRVKNKIETWIGMWIGALTFTGSIVAALKLNGNVGSKPLILFGNFRHFLNLAIMGYVVGVCPVFVIWPKVYFLGTNCGVSLFLGWHLIMAIGGADMPVVISMLNSYSGWATSFSGFMLDNDLLIISGALIGSSGAILSYIMCRGMNRSIVSVIAGGFGVEVTTEQVIEGEMVAAEVKEVVDDLMKAKSVICVPGYGMAVARAQNPVAQLIGSLRKMGKTCRFCIHPVAGRLPGHMNVLLAEANVPYDIVLEMEKINDDFAKTDVVLVIGANDIVNPDACDNPGSPIAGMPICKTWESKKVYINKRGKGKGYAAIENPLFYKSNSRMLYGNADTKIQEVANEVAKRAGDTVIKEEKKEEIMPEAGDDDIDYSEDLSPYLAKCVRVIGVPKEVSHLEKRVALCPKEVRQLVKLGFRVKIEEGAGVGSYFEDEDYIKNGGQIVSTKELWENTEIIVKVRGPEYNSSLGYHEADSLQRTNLLISYIYPAFNKELVDKLMADKPNLTVFALDCQPRTLSRAQKIDTLTSTTNITGYKAVLEAYNYLPRYSKQVMSAAGKIKQSTIFVIGCGIAGLAAISMARSMGANVMAFDSRSEVKDQIESLGAKFVILDFKEEGAGAGGYGKVMSEAYYAAQRKMVADTCKICDIVITTALIPGRKAPVLVYEEAIRNMKPGSVIVDMAAEMGGNVEMTRKGEVYEDPISKVKILGFYDLASRMSTQSSEVFSVNMWHLFNELCGIPLKKENNAKNFQIDINDDIVTALAIIHKGEYRWKPPGAPPPPKKEEPKQEKKTEVKKDGYQQLGDDKDESQNKKQQGCLARLYNDQLGGALMIFLFGAAIALLIGWGWYSDLIDQVGKFILSIFTGYLVIWNVTPSLHTPLMSETNAISGVIVVGAMITMAVSRSDRSYHPPVMDGKKEIEPSRHGNEFMGYSCVAWSSVLFASINIWGGFLVTQRMLLMFHR